LSETAKRLEDIPTVGSSTAQKLRAAGYNTVESIAVASSKELEDATGISRDRASKCPRRLGDASNPVSYS